MNAGRRNPKGNLALDVALDVALSGHSAELPRGVPTTASGTTPSITTGQTRVRPGPNSGQSVLGTIQSPSRQSRGSILGFQAGRARAGPISHQTRSEFESGRGWIGWCFARAEPGFARFGLDRGRIGPHSDQVEVGPSSDQTKCGSFRMPHQEETKLSK